MKYRAWEWCFLAAAACCVLAACLPWLPYLGLEADEAYCLPAAVRIAAGSPDKLPFPYGVTIGDRPFPFMLASYIGALDAYLYGLSFSLFGIGLVVFRVTNVVVSLVIVVLAYVLARRVSPKAAVLAVALLVMDVEFLLHAPTNFGPILLQVLCACLCVIFGQKWLQSAQGPAAALPTGEKPAVSASRRGSVVRESLKSAKGRESRRRTGEEPGELRRRAASVLRVFLESGAMRHIAASAFFLGAGFSEKLTFILFAASLGLSLLLFQARAVLRGLNWKSVLAAVAAFCAGCLPILLYTAFNAGAVFGFGRQSAIVPTDWTAVLLERYSQFRTLVDGQYSLTLVAPPPLGRFSVLGVAVLASSAYVLALAVARLAGRKRTPEWPGAGAFLLSVSAGVVLLSALFPESGRIHHLMLAYPFVHAGVAIVLWQLWESVRRVSKPAGFVLAAVILCATAASGFSTAKNIAWYSQQVRSTGGSGNRSAVIFEVARWLSDRPDPHVVFLAWGMFNPVFTLTEGRISCQEYLFQLLQNPLPDSVVREVEALLRRRGTIFFFNSLSPQPKLIQSNFFQVAVEKGFRPKLVKSFGGAPRMPLYEAYEFEEASAR